MDRKREQWDITEGTDVVGSDGEKVGKVIGVHQNYVVVEKGFFFPTDYYIPTSAIATHDGERITLNVTKDAALDQGWESAPEDDASYTSTAETVSTTDTDATDTPRTTTTRVEGDEVLRVPVHEEELSAVTREREIGQVQVSTSVVSEERVLDVPIVEERVRVQRVAVDREVGPDETTFQEGTITVPIRGEEVALQKRTRIAEEVEIAKEAVQHTEHVTGTVRREEVHVDESRAETTGSVQASGATDTTAPDATLNGGSKRSRSRRSKNTGKTRNR